jgi:hypothetical protein
VFKYIFKLIVLTILLLSCSDIERDNLLDPKNPDSYSGTPILIEAFVNTALEYDIFALQALDQIETNFGNQVEIIEYHRAHPADTSNKDPYVNSIFDELHDDYAEFYDDGPKAVPDIYINGSQGRVKGAYDMASVYSRLAPIITDIIGNQCEYALEVDLAVTGNLLNISYRIAHLGNKSDENLELHTILVKDYELPNANRVVNYVSYPDAELINKIDKGGYVKGNINDISITNQPDYAIFTITKQESITVLKTIKKEIPW